MQPVQRRVLVDGQPVTVGSRAFDVLVALAARAGELVAKSELIDLVWPGVVVEENNLQVQISVLRKLLGPQAIATIPGRGYRFTLPLEGGSAHEVKADSSGLQKSEGSAAIRDASVAPPALYGRTEDIAALTELIRQHALVTVVGPAGIGKTRLAQAVAHELREEFASGTRLVELAPLADPELVATTVARALGLKTTDARNAHDLVVQALADEHSLLVLDNCEHVLDAVDALVTAVREAAVKMRILATSQELLRHPDEHVYRLGSLRVPAADSTVAQARDVGAVQLFVARVQAIEPRFQLAETNVGAVIEICRRLDGISLAIELAAARVPLLGVQSVREKLDERFRLLTAGSRLALRRHQTLRAALEWSHSLLSEPEQSVFAKLGVFAGSFSLESAQKLAAGDTMDEWSVLDHLGALVDKSLVSVEGGLTARYRMLETTRAFALECLAALGATSQSMRRHAEVMLEVFERFYADVLAGTPPWKASANLASDLDNLRGALRWANDPGGDPRIAIALVGAVGARGYLHYVAGVMRDEMWHWCEALGPLVDASIDPAHAARFWLARAELSGVIAPLTGIEDARRAIAMYAQVADRVRACLAWNALAFCLTTTARFDEARDAMNKALDLRDPAWPPWLRCQLDNNASLLFCQAGAFRQARAHAQDYLSAARHMCSSFDEWTARTTLVDIDVAEGRTREASAAAREILARNRASREWVETGLGMRILATALMQDGHLEEAEPLYREAATCARQSFGTAAAVLYDAAMLVALRGRIDAAARLHGYSEAFYTDAGMRGGSSRASCANSCWHFWPKSGLAMRCRSCSPKGAA